MPFLVQDYLTGTVVLPELMCGKPRLKVTYYSKLGFLKFQDIPFTYTFSRFSGIYYVVFKRLNNFLLYSKRSSKIFRLIFLNKELTGRNDWKESCLICGI